MTVGDEKSHLPTNTTTRRHDSNNDDCDDDKIARLATMCTNTMHGNEWLIPPFVEATVWFER